MSEDSIDGILDSLERAATLCHHNADIGFNVHCIRAKNTPIRGTGGMSNGLVPMLKAYNTSIPTVCQNSQIEGPITVYLEPWHSDIFEFLELKKNIGDYYSLLHCFFLHTYSRIYMFLTNVLQVKNN